MKNQNSSNISLGLALLAIGCAAFSAFFTYFPLTDGDIFWHLAAGREMAARKHFLFIDPFSFTVPSARWIDLHWFFQLLAYGLYVVGAEKALLVSKLTVVGLVAFLLCRTFPSKRSTLIAAACTPLVFFQVRYLIDVRPVLITIVCMAFYVFLFEHARRTGKNRALWWCLPLQIIWTNSQGLYMIGLFIIGAYWLEELAASWRKRVFARHNVQLAPNRSLGEVKVSRVAGEFPSASFRKREQWSNENKKPIAMSMVFCACILSCCLNPYCLSGLLLPLKLFSRISPGANNIYSMNISENIPLFSLTGHDTIYRSTALCIAICTGVLFWVNKKKVRFAHLILFGGFLLLACSAMRNVLLFAIIAIPIMVYNASYGNFGDFCNTMRKETKIWISWVLIIVFLSVLFLDTYHHLKIIATFPPHRMISPFRFPEKIIEGLKQHPIPGEMFNDIRYGGYLIWRLYPEKRVFIDTRLIIRPPRFFAEYLTLCDDPELFPQVARKFGVTQVILPSAIFPMYLKLIKWLYQSDEWHLQYADGASVLFVKNGAAVGPQVNLSDTNSLKAIVDDINSQWEHSEFVRREAYAYFIELVKYLGLPGSADFIQNQISLRKF